MPTFKRLAWFFVPVLAVVFGLPNCGQAEITPEQRREVAEIRGELGKVATLLRKKEYDAATEAIDDAEARLNKIVEEAGIEPTDRAVASAYRLIGTRRTAIAKITGVGGAAGGVSFVKDVAPILNDNCLGCHGNDARGGLRLDTFAGMEQGGNNKPLLVVGNPRASRLAGLLIHPNPASRMPRGRPALPADQIATIAKWITEGAKFDGNDKSAVLSQLKPAGTPAVKIEVAMATGDESVSFTKDIAPFMAQLCVGCHSGANPRGGLSLVTFEDLLRGGDSGEVLIAGNLEDSRLWRLVGGLENPRMPQGQARITRKNYNDLREWILEGLKFDGQNPKTPLREMIPSPQDLRRAELNAMSADEFAELRANRSRQQWKRALPRATANTVQTDNFQIFGDVPVDRLERVGSWAEAHAEKLSKLFGVTSKPLWKGKLAIFVISDRFGYEEFNRTIHSREVPATVMGHSEVTPTYEDAFVALQELGDAPTPSEPSLQMSVVENVTAAFIEREGGGVPDWLLRGAGLAVAGSIPDAQPYLTGMKLRAREAVARVNRPDELFADGTFGPGEVTAVGYTLVDFLIDAEGPQKFGQLVARLKKGDGMQAAATAVYGIDLRGLATAYGQALAR